MISYQTAAPGSPLVKVESPTPKPSGSEVLLKIVACGVCHSDIHLHDGVFELGGGKQLDVGQEGLTLGHEIFGEVLAMGPDATGVAVGDRISEKEYAGLDPLGVGPRALAASAHGACRYGARRRADDGR